MPRRRPSNRKPLSRHPRSAEIPPPRTRSSHLPGPQSVPQRARSCCRRSDPEIRLPAAMRTEATYRLPFGTVIVSSRSPSEKQFSYFDELVREDSKEGCCWAAPTIEKLHQWFMCRKRDQIDSRG